MIRSRFGLWTSLSAAQVAQLEAARVDHFVVANYHSRLRVADLLTHNGQSVGRLFAEAR